jgi:hypothetical protein
VHNPSSATRVLGVAAIAVALSSIASSLPAGAATIGGLGMPSAPSFQRTLDPDGKGKKKTVLYIGDNANNRITVYDVAKKKSTKVGVITQGLNGPQGITTDTAGNLYVTNLYGNTVTVYASGQTSPMRTYSTEIQSPTDVRVDSSGNVYIANSPGFGAASYILEFPAGSMSPNNVWYTPQINQVISGIALLNPSQPGQTSIYAAAYTENGSGFATGTVLSCYPGNGTCVSLGYNMGQTGGVAVLESPGLNQPFQFLAVDQYIPGYDNIEPGHSSSQATTGGTPEFLAIDAARTDLFVADRFYGRVTEYAFPGGQIVNQFYPQTGGDNPQVYGVAVSPAGTYF